jgi:hypothetical protein
MESSWREERGGDYSRTIVCPGCGAELCNTRWPDHFRSSACEGGDQS